MGSGKGGVGKSFISGSLITTIAALGPLNKKVYGVDLDLDNKTLSSRLPPPGAIDALVKKLIKARLKYLNLADILHQGVVPTDGYMIPRFKGRTLSCNQQPIPYSFNLIPTYDVLRTTEQMTVLRQLDSRLLREGIDALLTYFLQKTNKGEDFVAVFDGKQKSNIGIEWEPLYRLMIEQTDLFILVTEPPYLTFSSVTMPYKRFLDKTIIVVNKAEPSHMDKILLLVRDAVTHNVPVFIVPKDSSDEVIYNNNFQFPPAVSLKRRTSLYIMGLALFLNLLDEELLSQSGCIEPVYRLLRKIGSLYSSLR